MRNASQGQPLQGLAFEWHPLPVVIDLGNTEAAFKAWDSAWASFHDEPSDTAAMRLAQEE